MTHQKSPSRSRKNPSYCRQRRRDGHDLAFVHIRGQRTYLGPWDTPESREAYHRLLADMEASAGSPPVPAQQITIAELVNQYLNWADADETIAPSSFHALQAVAGLKYGRCKAHDNPPVQPAPIELAERVPYSRVRDLLLSSKADNRDACKPPVGSGPGGEPDRQGAPKEGRPPDGVVSSDDRADSRDDGAKFGRFDVIIADGGITGMFDEVILPEGDWSWDSNGSTVYVQHVPEPFALTILGIGGLALLKRKKTQ